MAFPLQNCELNYTLTGPLCGSRYIATVLSTLWNERNLVLRVEH